MKIENDLALVKKLKEENDKLSKEVEAFKDRLLRITASLYYKKWKVLVEGYGYDLH